MGQAEKNDVFDLFARFSQAPAKEHDQPDRNFGVILEQRDKISPFDDHQFAVINGDGVGGPLPTIEKGYFAEQLAGHHQIEYRVLSLLRGGADSYCPSTNGIELRADVPLSEYDSA